MTTFQSLAKKIEKVDKKFIIVAAISLVILCFSFYQEYIQKVDSCYLCKLQRIPYLLILIFFILNVLNTWRSSYIRCVLNGILSLSIGLAFYHAAIQYGLLNDQCAVLNNFQNDEEFFTFLEKPMVSCALIKWKLGGLSASIWNMITTFFLILILNFKKFKNSKSYNSSHKNFIVN